MIYCMFCWPGLGSNMMLTVDWINPAVIMPYWLLLTTQNGHNASSSAVKCDVPWHFHSDLRLSKVLLAVLHAVQVRAGATLRFPRTLPFDRDDPDAFKLHVHRLSLKTLW
jgi:hypothetical protein